MYIRSYASYKRLIPTFGKQYTGLAMHMGMYNKSNDKSFHASYLLCFIYLATCVSYAKILFLVAYFL